MARLGGEEFVVIMPETPIDLSQMVADRLRKKISATTINGEKDGLTVTVSIGCAAATGKMDDTQAALLGRADAALYKAKNEGRDRVIIG